MAFRWDSPRPRSYQDDAQNQENCGGGIGVWGMPLRTPESPSRRMSLIRFSQTPEMAPPAQAKVCHFLVIELRPGPTADAQRDLFKRGKYPDVILPMCVIRRMDTGSAKTDEPGDCLNDISYDSIARALTQCWMRASMIKLAKPLKLLLLAFAALSLSAQPLVTAVTNAADYTATLAPGAIAAVFGTNLAPSDLYPSGLPLPTILNTVQVMVDGKAAPLFYVSPTQINFQVPYETAVGQASLSVISAGHPSNPFNCVVGAFSLGIFEAGAGFGVIQNPDHSANSSTNPVAGGAVVLVYITGIGA